MYGNVVTNRVNVTDDGSAKSRLMFAICVHIITTYQGGVCHCCDVCADDFSHKKYQKA